MKNQNVIRIGLVFLSVLALLIAPIDAKSAKSVHKTVKLITGKADTVDLSMPAADVLVANPAVVDVGSLRSNRLYVVGKQVGETNILVYDETGNQLANIAVHVRVDDKGLQETLRDLFPNEKVMAKTVQDNIVLTGSVTSPGVANKVRDLATRFLQDAESQAVVDLMSVRSEQQVLLKVKIVEVKRSALRELGMETDFRTATTRGLRFSGNDVGRSVLTPFGQGVLGITDQSPIGALTANLRALETNGLVNTLAEPNLTAISGETAGFLAGGEFPVPSGRDSQGNVIIDFKKFGVSLNFTPTVLDRDRIALNLSTEVSEKDRNNGVTLEDVQIDGLTVRRAETTVEIASGGSIMIAGLIKSDTLHNLNGLPGAQEIPVLGQLFKSKSFTRNESELLIVVTPYLVNPYAEAAAIEEIETPAPIRMPATAPSPPAKMGNIEASEPLHPLEKVDQAQLAPLPPVTAVAPDQKEELVTVSVLPRPRPQIAMAAKEPLLSAHFMSDIRKVYGQRVPASVSVGKTVGYIVD